MKNIPLALTIGNFDGVHRGHRALIEKVLSFKRQWTSEEPPLKTAVVTFDPHPIEVLRPGVLVPRLCSLSERCEWLQNAGIDEVHVIPFTEEFARTSAEDFFQKVLVKNFNPAFLAVGHDFHFGYQKQGTPGRMVDWAREAGIALSLVPAIEADGAPVSSSRIRKLLDEGMVIQAARLLGRDYSLTGQVLHGDKRGRQLGFPTANLIPLQNQLAAPCLPKKGVYLSNTTLEGRTFASVTNVGTKPTVSQSPQITVETHLLDFDGDLYGKQITVEFRDRLRDETRFGSLDELKHQIQIDTDKARGILKNR